MLKLGTQNISSLYVGGEKIKRALVGEDVVFEDTPEYTVYFYAIEGADTGKILNSSVWTVAPGGSVMVYPWNIDGYVFEGWYEGDALLSNAAGAFEYTPTKTSTTIYLRYEVVYTLSVNVGSEITGVTVLLNGEAVLNPQLSRRYVFKPGTQITLEGRNFPSGWKFSYWYNNWTSFSYTNPWTFTMPSKNVSVSLEGEKASRLPEGYTELEWIETTAKTSYITLYSTAAAINCVDMDVMIPGSGTLSGSGNRYFFDSGDSSNFIGFYHYTTGTTADNGRYSNNSIGSSYTITGSTVPKDKKFNVKWDPLNKKVSFNGVSAAMNGTKASTMKLYVGSANYSGCECLRYYEVRVTVGSTVITFVPCKRNSDNKLGLFILGNTTNSGYKPVYSTANWTAGPAV